MTETLGEAYRLGWRATASCIRRDPNPKNRRGQARTACGATAELDMKTLIWTRGASSPLTLLESRLRCPSCGKPGATVRFTVPRQPPDFDLYSEENRKSYEAGDKAALFRAIEQCALFRRAMPEWASGAFDLIYRAALAGEIRSWDDVFGRPWQQEKPRAQQRGVQTQSWKWQVWKLVRELHEEEGKPPIDNALFERVGRQLGIGNKSTVAALYGSVERAVRRVRGDEG